MLTLRSGEFKETDLSAFEATYTIASTAALIKARATLSAAAAAVTKCAGIKKLAECLASLEAVEALSLDKMPKILPTTPLAAFNFIGVPAGDKRRLSPMEYTMLKDSWSKHRDGWTAEMASWTPEQEWQYYRTLSGISGSALLGDMGLRALLRPLSSAGCERVFSYLKQMDDATRRTMDPETLELLLFLRANWRIVKELQSEAALSFREATSDSVLSGKKRQGDEALAKAGAAVAAAHAAAAEARAKADLLAAAAAAAAAVADESDGEAELSD